MRYGGYYMTAYGLAVKHGFRGTEADWLESLTGRGLRAVEMLEDGTLRLVYTDGEKRDIPQYVERANFQDVEVVEHTLRIPHYTE